MENSYLYAAGDRVVVRHDLEVGEYYAMRSGPRNGREDSVTHDMASLAGNVVEIRSRESNGEYRIKGMLFYWTDDMFEGLECDHSDACPIDANALDSILEG